MTTAVLEPGPGSAAWPIGRPRLLAGLDRYPSLDARTHLATHGPLPGVDLDRMLALLDAAGVTGRGGAGFPFAAKLRALRGRQPLVVVNGAESEPASAKDRALLARSPHLVLDGALAVATAVRASRVVVAVHDSSAREALQRAAHERPDARRVRIEHIAGGFVAGEARAVLRALAGGRPVPPGRRTPPTEHGRLVSNVETFAQLALLIRLGARGFADTGTPTEPGTTLLTIGGSAGRPGVVEIPLGAPLGIVLRAALAEHARFVVTGGYHGTWLRPSADLPLSRAGLQAIGASLGAGVLLTLDDSTCALGELARVAGWLAAQSARQCGPCRFGLPALAADVAAAAHGHPAAVANALRHASVVTGRGACAHPDGAVRFVRSGLAVMPDELAAHAAGGCGRPVRGVLPIGGAS
jgi:NADH:ubiquinone oxidoreductase subunit F (NADH-binding)